MLTRQLRLMSIWNDACYDMLVQIAFRDLASMNFPFFSCQKLSFLSLLALIYRLPLKLSTLLIRRDPRQFIFDKKAKWNCQHGNMLNTLALVTWISSIAWCYHNCECMCLVWFSHRMPYKMLWRSKMGNWCSTSHQLCQYEISSTNFFLPMGIPQICHSVDLQPR